jgi:hypothetical protein
MTTHTIRVQDPARRYWFKAITTRKTGAVLAVRAGCRHWRNFDAAFAHYDAHAKKGIWGWPRWSDGWILSARDSRNPGVVEQRLYERHHARVTLHWLKEKVEDAQRAKRRRNRK